MDILDAVNAKIMTESWERRAGIWYDPYKRALEILREYMDEDAFQDMQARMAAQADEYLKNRDSSLRMATHQPGVADPEPEQEDLAPLAQAAKDLDEIRRLAIRDNYTIGHEAIDKLAEIISVLQQADQSSQAGMGNKLRGLARKAQSYYTRGRPSKDERKAKRQQQKLSRRRNRESMGESIDTELESILSETRDAIRTLQAA